MATRTIVTSQPDVECDVCERRLLRGEQPDIFLAAGRRRTVCELCAPRAAHEGWLRETSQASVALPPMRPRRGRSLLDRFRQAGRPADGDAPETPAIDGADVPYDLFDVPAEPDPGGQGTSVPVRAGAPVAEVPVEAPRGQLILEQALAAFNAGEYPRRVSGVARSLGAPVVSVRSAEHHEEVVRIVVAWELCWYRYEVDLGDGSSAAAIATGQGTELSELAREECEGNAVAQDTGAIILALQ
jgi:hypothetical protein